MIGMIHKVLFDLVKDHGGDEALIAIKKKAGVPAFKPFFINMDYSDDECLALIGATAEYFGMSDEEVNDAYAEQFLNYALDKFSRFFVQANSAREFLEMQPRIHAKFAGGKTSSEDLAKVSRKFKIVNDGTGDLVIRYSSHSSLCGLYEALAKRLFKHYGEEGSIVQDQCAHRGDAACRFRIQFESGASHSDFRLAS